MALRKILILCGLAVFGWSGEGGALAGPELLMLDLMNALRTESEVCWDGSGWRAWEGAEHELVLSASLSRAAARHNAVMIEQACFEHTCPGEDALPKRVAATGYTDWRFLAENIGGGFGAARDMFALWQASEGHRRNVLSCFARAVGIDRAEASGLAFGWLWTADFGDAIEEVEADPQAVFAHFFDDNLNGRVDDDEVLAALAVWILGGTVGGVAVDDALILEIVRLWISDA